jgi:hypothetical protein
MPITKEKMEAYLKVQKSGTTNMFDIFTVSVLSNLSKEEIVNIKKWKQKIKKG